MSEELDKMAQAIGNAAAREGRIEDWPSQIQEHYRKLARAAIEAARRIVRERTAA